MRFPIQFMLVGNSAFQFLLLTVRSFQFGHGNQKPNAKAGEIKAGTAENTVVMILFLPSHLRGLSVDLRGLCVKLLILVAAMLLQVLRG